MKYRHDSRIVSPARPRAYVFAMLIASGLVPIAPTASQAGETNQEMNMVQTPRQEDAGARHGVKGLPHADPDRVFANLDQYLAHRARVAAMGAPALREISPGRYAEEFRDGTSHSYTREELLRMFGFDE